MPWKWRSIRGRPYPILEKQISTPFRFRPQDMHAEQARASFTAYPEGSSVEMTDLPPPSTSCGSQLLSYLKLEERNVSLAVEIRSGLISFMTMSYVSYENSPLASPNPSKICTQCS